MCAFSHYDCYKLKIIPVASNVIYAHSTDEVIVLVRFQPVFFKFVFIKNMFQALRLARAGLRAPTMTAAARSYSAGA